MATETITEEEAHECQLTEEYKEENRRICLGENVYSLLVVAPLTSWSFLVSFLVVCLKLLILLILSSDITYDNIDPLPRGALSFVKFFLIPVAIAMQEDLMETFNVIANGMWCETILEQSASATRPKVYFGYILRGFDGCLSLYVNYGVLLITGDSIISVFLNFAALQFIYAIDDIFYELMKLGFFGDQMEHMTMVCGDCSLKRRFGKDDFKIGKFNISSLDTILFFILMFLAHLGYFIYIGLLYREKL